MKMTMEMMVVTLLVVVAMLLIAVLMAMARMMRKVGDGGGEALRSSLQMVREEMARTLREQLAESRMELNGRVEALRREVTANQALQLRQLQETLNSNLLVTNQMQREKLEAVTRTQEQLVAATEKRLDDMRLMVEEKLQKTLNERIGRSFELVCTQLESVQQGLGEMRSLAQDVGGLKRVLTNVKTRGTFGEVQLAALLEQMLSPEQYAANVKTKRRGTEYVEFAVKLPGKEEGVECVYLPIDAKFPKDVYEQYVDACEEGDAERMNTTSRLLEQTVKRMARDIRDKYLEPPCTTDFGIMFLPFENIYAEIIRRTSLVEQLRRECHIIVTGPTTLGAILNSLQMGFRTLAIEKRTSEVWKVLAAVKTEFGNFGGMLQKVQSTLETAGTQLDEVLGRRTRAIERKLRSIEELTPEQSARILEMNEGSHEL